MPQANAATHSSRTTARQRRFIRYHQDPSRSGVVAIMGKPLANLPTVRLFDPWATMADGIPVRWDFDEHGLADFIRSRFKIARQKTELRRCWLRASRKRVNAEARALIAKLPAGRNRARVKGIFRDACCNLSSTIDTLNCTGGELLAMLRPLTRDTLTRAECRELRDNIWLIRDYAIMTTLPWEVYDVNEPLRRA